MRVVALVPARAGSKGIPEKNFRSFADGSCLVWRACVTAFQVFEPRIANVYVSSDAQPPIPPGAEWIERPAELAQDDTPMLDVVKHALGEIPGEPDDIIVLLQPTQPFRTPEHVRQAVHLLRETQADSVVSAVGLPRTHHPDFQYGVGRDLVLWGYTAPPHERPTRRQDVSQTYRFDGTCYVFWRRTVTEYGSIFGADQRALIIPADASCELDTLEDWTAAERRWKEQHG